MLRRAMPDDAEKLIESVNSVGAEGRYILTERLPYTVEEERKIIASWDGVNTIMIVADDGEKIVGGSGWVRGKYPKTRHVMDIGIHIVDGWRGVGLGEAMMRAGMEWARSLGGVRKLFLEVFSTNERALALYRKLGFVEEGRKKGHFVIDGDEVDDVLMAMWS